MTNVLIICSDQHRRDALGCYGHSHVQTPHLDRMSKEGTRFSQAYCNAPICVPSRASLATGLPIHKIPSWDNADPYHGQRTSFMHRAQNGGVETISIGKLHFRNAEDDTGFDRQILPMHVVNGTGTFYSILRDPIPRIRAGGRALNEAGAGETGYTRYDHDICAEAERWLLERSATRTDRPFLLNVSFVNPHPPYQAPKALFDKYMSMDLPLPEDTDWCHHPALSGIRRYFDMENLRPDIVRKSIAAAYFANIEYLDQNIGKVLAALDASGYAEDTLVLYISDHGESLGNAGLYGKCNLFEPSAGIPMILKGPGVPADQTCDTPAQLLDIYPTILDALNISPIPEDSERSGRSLIALAKQPNHRRWVLIQQHCAGSTSASYALSDGATKFIYFNEFPPMLFDLVKDPDERHDLAADPRPKVASHLRELEVQLRNMIDPEAIDTACRASQAARAQAQGGFESIMAGARQTAHTPAPTESPS